MFDLIWRLFKMQRAITKISLGCCILIALIFSLLSTLSTYYLSEAFEAAESESSDVIVFILLFVAFFLIARIIFEPRWIVYAIWDGNFLKSFVESVYIEILLNYHNSNHIPEAITARVLNAARNFRELTTNLLFSIIPISFEIIFSIIFILIYYPKYTVSFALSVVAYFIAAHFVLNQLKEKVKSARERQSDLDGTVTSLLKHADETRGLNAIGKSFSLLENFTSDNRKAIILYNLHRSLLAILQFLPLAISIIAHNIYFYLQYEQGNAEIGAIVFINSLLTILARRLEMLGTSIRQVQLNWSFINGVKKFLNRPNEASETEYKYFTADDSDLLISCSELDFDHIELNKLISNLQISRGDKLAIIGPSGCGKSTYLKTLSGVSSASSGNIAYSSALESSVFQNNRPDITFSGAIAVIYHTSLQENVAFHDRQTEADVSRIIKDLEIPFDSAQELGTSNFSDGEKKRIHFARAIASQSPVIILDEPFTNVEKRLVKKMAAYLIALDDTTVIISCQNSKGG